MGRQAQASVDLARVITRELNALGHTTLSAKSLATGIKRSTLYRRLQGQSFTVDELGQVASAIGWRLSDLVGAAEDAAA